MNIRVLDNYELRGDSLQWQVWQLKAVKKKDGTESEEWVGLQSYHGSIGAALEWIVKHVPRAQYSAVEADLKGAIDELRFIAREIGRHAKAFERAMAGDAE